MKTNSPTQKENNHQKYIDDILSKLRENLKLASKPWYVIHNKIEKEK